MENQHVTIKITGMTCSHCVNTVKNLVQDERGVQSLNISLESGELKIYGDKKMNRDQIVKAINLSGVYHAE